MCALSENSGGGGKTRVSFKTDSIFVDWDDIVTVNLLTSYDYGNRTGLEMWTVYHRTVSSYNNHHSGDRMNYTRPEIVNPALVKGRLLEF